MSDLLIDVLEASSIVEAGLGIDSCNSEVDLSGLDGVVQKFVQSQESASLER